jgi:hypothetical protein
MVLIFGVSWAPSIESQSIPTEIVADLPDCRRTDRAVAEGHGDEECEAPWLAGAVARACLTDCTACMCRELGAGLRTLLDARVLTLARVCL